MAKAKKFNSRTMYKGMPEKDLNTVLDIFLKNQFEDGLELLHKKYKDNFLDFAKNFQLAETILQSYKISDPNFKKKINSLFYSDFANELVENKKYIPNIVEKYKILHDAEQYSYLENCLQRKLQKQEIQDLIHYIIDEKTGNNGYFKLGSYVKENEIKELDDKIKNKLVINPDVLLGAFLNNNVDLLKALPTLDFKVFQNYEKNISISSLSKKLIKENKIEISSVKKTDIPLGAFNNSGLNLIPLIMNVPSINKGKNGRIERAKLLHYLLHKYPNLFFYNDGNRNFTFDILNSELIEISDKISLLKAFSHYPQFSFNQDWTFDLARAGEFPIVMFLITEKKIDLNHVFKKEKLKDYLYRKFNKNSEFDKLIAQVEKRDLKNLNTVMQNTNSSKKILL